MDCRLTVCTALNESPGLVPSYKWKLHRVTSAPGGPTSSSELSYVCPHTGIHRRITEDKMNLFKRRLVFEANSIANSFHTY